MKICVSAFSGSLESQIDPRFGRCQYFVFIDVETMNLEVMPNTGKEAVHGAGINAAQTVADTGAKVVLTGNIGPNAFQVLSSAGIKVATSVFGTVREAIEKYKRGELEEVKSPTSGGHFGAGRRRGRRSW